MRVFVTGATGVLGRWVVRLLVEAGEMVRGFSRSQENTSTLRAIGAEPVEADLFQREILYRAMKDCDAVLHLATKIPSLGRFRSREAWEDNDRIRLDATRNLVDVALELEVKTLVIQAFVFCIPTAGRTGLIARTQLQRPTPFCSQLSKQKNKYAALRQRGAGE